VISDASTKACHGEQIEIRTPHPAAVKRVVLVRCGSVTHNFNPDQRHITLEFRHEKGNVLLATVPSNGGVAIAGYYLLFILDAQRRPSEGRFIQICNAPAPGRPWPWEDSGSGSQTSCRNASSSTRRMCVGYAESCPARGLLRADVWRASRPSTESTTTGITKTAERRTSKRTSTIKKRRDIADRPLILVHHEEPAAWR
jgi:Domain of unknown function (DUF1929)